MRTRAWRLAALAALLLVGCGGGSTQAPVSPTAGSSGSDTSGPGSGTSGIEGSGFHPRIVSNGAITGLGSIIVEGVEYALDNATITVNGQPGSAADLLVGQVVTLTATGGSDTAHANAVSVTYETDMQGPIESVSNDGSQLTILGQLVDLDAQQVWKVGDTVALSGFRDAQGIWLVRRITPVSTGSLVVSGVVENVDTTAKTFAIGALSIAYSGAALQNITGDLQAGMNVRVTGSRGNGTTFQAGTVLQLDPALPGAKGDSAYIEGWVTALTSQQQFDVNNHHVATSASTTFWPSDSAPLSTASFVQVSGLRTADGGVEAFNVTVCNMSPVTGTTATLMRNGKVLLLGGDPCGDFAGVFDTSSSTFAAAGRLATTRFAPLVEVLSDGRVLIAGGWGGQYTTYPDGSTSTYANLTSTEIFDPASGHFSAGPSMATGHIAGTVTLLSDGRVLIAGGGGFCSTERAELLNAAATAFSAAGSMATQRAHHTATLLSDGSVLIAGGSNGCAADAADDPPWDPLFAELFDPSSETFKTTGSMSTTRWNHSAFRVSDDAVLVFGGVLPLQNRHEQPANPAYAEIYHVGAHAFTPFSIPQQQQVAGTVTQLRDGQILFLGGQVTGTPIDTAALLNPTTGVVANAGSLSTPRAGHTATLLDDGRVLVVGGTGPAGTEIPPFEYWSPTP